jgi:transposase-like protein
MWQLTFMVDGKKRVERIPNDWVDEIAPLVEQGREYKDAVAEVFAINAQLLALWRQQHRKKR